MTVSASESANSGLIGKQHVANFKKFNDVWPGRP